MSKPAEDLLEGIRVLMRAFTIDESKFPPAEGRIKYNTIDFQTLYFIENNPDCLGSELAIHLGISPTTAQSTCDRLVKRGFVDRKRHQTDRRARSLSLTPEGKSVAAAIKRQDLANCEAMLRKLPSEQQATFASQVRTIAGEIAEPNNG